MGLEREATHWQKQVALSAVA